MKNLVEFAIKHGEKLLDDFDATPEDLDFFTYVKHEGYQYKVPNDKMCWYFRKCKNCLKDISPKHPNAKFCNLGCKDKFHNSQPDRIARSKKYAKPKAVTTTVSVRTSVFEEALDAKINHPFADMSEFGDRG